MAFDLNTNISINELVDWHLHWLIVDVDFSLLKHPDLPVADVKNKVTRLLSIRSGIVNQLNTIYDHPDKLDEQLRQLPKWQLLEQKLEAARQQAIKSSMASHLKHLELTFGTRLKEDNDQDQPTV